MIRLSKSTVGDAEKAAVCKALDAEYLGMGDEVRLFEEELAAFVGGDRHVIAVNTGTAALHLALQAAGIGPGDEVLVPSITYVACFQAVSAVGAKPIACDVLQETLFLDSSDAQKRVTKATKAVLPVHYASDSQHIPDVYRFAESYGLSVVEDAAHSFGCERDNLRIGASGNLVCFSFDGIKNITSGEGGAVITGDSELAERIRDARLLGVQKDTEKRYQGGRSWEFDVSSQGYRYHMSNIMAAIGRAQLTKFECSCSKRQRLVSNYLNLLEDLPEVKPLPLNYQHNMSHIFVVKVDPLKREGLRSHLLSQGIETGVHYFPNHWLTYYKSDYPLPCTEKVYSEILSLPLHLDLKFEHQLIVVDEIKRYLK